MDSYDNASYQDFERRVHRFRIAILQVDIVKVVKTNIKNYYNITIEFNLANYLVDNMLNWFQRDADFINAISNSNQPYMGFKVISNNKVKLINYHHSMLTYQYLQRVFNDVDLLSDDEKIKYPPRPIKMLSKKHKLK